eukprot:GHVL01020640.1.p1 GENE.GHVL01020640.1~~GHVL01020640.1.p1  ORF type:complete len:341 (+),score=56.91 GHVL01020640.1:58-1080(+)
MNNIVVDRRCGGIMEMGEFLLSKNLNNLEKTLTAIKLAAKVVNRYISKANSFGLGDDQTVTKDIHTIANDTFLDALINRQVVAGIASSHMDDIISIPKCVHCKHVVLINPLDGIKQFDVNVSVGTIFSIYERVTEIGTPVGMCDFLQPGKKQIAAGYVIYGSSTMFIFTVGDGVHGFTLDPSLGTLYLSHPCLNFPPKGSTYSLNGGKRRFFPEGVKEYINICQSNGYSLRYIGSLVADFHRNLLKGGIYIYPPTFKDQRPSVSMMFQCNPVAFLCEQAHGKASDGFTRILDIEPVTLLDRVPFFCGSNEMVMTAEKCMAAKKMKDGGWCFGPPGGPPSK